MQNSERSIYRGKRSQSELKQFGSSTEALSGLNKKKSDSEGGEGIVLKRVGNVAPEELKLERRKEANRSASKRLRDKKFREECKLLRVVADFLLEPEKRPRFLELDKKNRSSDEELEYGQMIDQLYRLTAGKAGGWLKVIRDLKVEGGGDRREKKLKNKASHQRRIRDKKRNRILNLMAAAAEGRGLTFKDKDTLLKFQSRRRKLNREDDFEFNQLKVEIGMVSEVSSLQESDVGSAQSYREESPDLDLDGLSPQFSGDVFSSGMTQQGLSMIEVGEPPVDLFNFSSGYMYVDKPWQERKDAGDLSEQGGDVDKDRFLFECGDEVVQEYVDPSLLVCGETIFTTEVFQTGNLSVDQVNGMQPETLGVSGGGAEEDDAWLSRIDPLLLELNSYQIRA